MGEPDAITRTPAEVGATPAPEGAGRAAVADDVPLTPIQHWFFEQEPPEPEHYNHVVLLAVRPELRSGLLGQALTHLLLRHDALRLRFERGEAGWRQVCAAPGHVPFAELDFSAQSENERDKYFEAVTTLLERRLNLSRGPLVRAALLNFGGDGARYLLLVIHRLVADDFSRHILLEDLALAYRQLHEGRPLELPPGTSPYREWAHGLSRHAQSARLRQEADYWQAEARKYCGPLPVDSAGGGDSAAPQRAVTVRLGAKETEDLLSEVTRAHGAGVEAVLLTALAETFKGWTGAPSLLVEVEGDGRVSLGGELDLSRTVGWCSARFPVHLRLPDGANAGEKLRAVAEQLGGIPDKGLGYMALCYQSADVEATARMRSLPRAEVSFRYAGRLDHDLPQSHGFARVAKAVGLSRDGRGRPPYPFEINCGLEAGRLLVSWASSWQGYRAATVENLAHAFVGELRHLIARCLRAGAGYAPSDFPNTDLSQRELDAIVAYASSNGGADNLENVYPLSPLQQGMLFHLQLSPGAGMYLNQMRCTLRGELDVAAFRRAFQQVIDRQTVLRTAFAWGSHNRPLQVVHRRMELPWEQHDWRHMPEAEQQEGMQAILREGQARGFDLSRIPLLSVVLIRLRDDVYQLFWSYHLMILDGWSTSLILKEVIAAYGALRRGTRAGLEPPVPYRNYIEWLQQQDRGEAEAFWRQALHGFTTPTPLVEDRAPSAAHATDDPFREMGLGFDEAETDTLRTFSRRHRLTLNTLTQAAWALLLSRRSGMDDVVFGSVVSGRPADLPGIESAVGLFINTLPVRVSVTHDAPVLPWLQALQAQQAHARRFEYTPLVDIQGWSGVPRGRNLFESILIFQNFPSDVSLSEPGAKLRVVDMGLVERNSYPLTLVVEPGPRLLVKLVYDTRRFADSSVARLMENFRRLLLNMLSNAGGTLASLSPETEVESTPLLDDFNQTL